MNDHSSAPQSVEKTATDARQGATTGTVRWVLGISLFGAIIALAITYALVHGV
jgi:hypothetical protein